MLQEVDLLLARRRMVIGLGALLSGMHFDSIGFARSWNESELKNWLEAHRVQFDLPALGVAVIVEGKLRSVTTTGIRKRGEKPKVTDEDLWHLGSCGKAMTATLVGKLVEQGLLNWDKTLAEYFPDVASKMNPNARAINLVHLLAHRSGLPANFDLDQYRKISNVGKARRTAVLDAAELKQKDAPGTRYLYSNWGYVIAAAIAESVTGKGWEKLMREEIFQPLKMESAGFGGIGTIGKIDQPWPHTQDGKPTASNGPKVDNPPAMGPAGRIHMNLADWSKFIIEHLKGPNGDSELLTADTYKKLHTEVGDQYALGWLSMKRGWGGNIIHHNGDNTMNHAVVWAAPEKRFAVLVVTNQSSAGAAVDPVCARAIQDWQNGKA